MSAAVLAPIDHDSMILGDSPEDWTVLSNEDGKQQHETTEKESNSELAKESPPSEKITETALVVYNPTAATALTSFLMRDESKEPPQKLRRTHVGMRNLGNTCYLNSAIQMLLSLDGTNSFINEFIAEYKQSLSQESQNSEENSSADEKKQEPTKEEEEKEEQPLRNALAKLFLSLQTSVDGAPVDPRDLKSTVDKMTSQFIGYRQQDSHEFLSTLLDLLHDEAVAAAKKLLPQEEGKEDTEEKIDDNTDDGYVLVSKEREPSEFRRTSSFKELSPEAIEGFLRENVEKSDDTKTSPLHESTQQETPQGKLVGGRASPPSSDMEVVAETQPSEVDNDEKAQSPEQHAHAQNHSATTPSETKLGLQLTHISQLK